MKKFLGMFLFAVLFASGAMAEKVDSKGKACGSVKGVANCLSGCWENGSRLSPDKCANSLRNSGGPISREIAPGVERRGAPNNLYE